MTKHRAVAIALLAISVIGFWGSLFYLLPWWVGAGVMLGTTTAWGAVAYAEMHIDIEHPSPEDMANQPDLWAFPQRCHEAPDRYKEAA